jgi:hypothetical protein
MTHNPLAGGLIPMARHVARMMAGPLVRQQLAERDGPAAGRISVTADALGPSIRPAAAQLAGGADAAPPAIAVQRVRQVSTSQVAASMKSKSHAPHGGSANSNTHAAQKGRGQRKGLRRQLALIANSQAKQAPTAAAAAPTKGKGKKNK